MAGVQAGQQIAAVEKSLEALETNLKQLADMAASLEPVEAKHSLREVMSGLDGLLRDLVSAKSGVGGADAAQVTKIEKRINEALTKASKIRAAASNKHATAMEPLRVEVGQSILAMMAKRKKKDEDEDIFPLVDTNGDGFVSRDEFLAFIESCPGTFSRDSLGKLFDYLDDARTGRLERDDFLRCVHIYHRVSRPQVDLVQTMGVAQGKLVRKLDVNEILELLEGPIKEITKVVRVKCRALKDSAIGWTTSTGSNGVLFVEQKRVHFQVKSSTTLTDVLSAKTCTTIRQLKEGELIEVFVWEKTDPTTGLKRLKGRALKDGAVGWATVVGNKDTVHLQMV